MLNEGLQHYKNIEASLQKALVLAEKTSEETIRTAELKAQTIEMEAVNKAKAHTADAKHELERVHNQTVALVQQYTKYKAQFTQFLNAQMDLINSDSFRMEASEFAAFTKSAASANDAYINSNPMSDFISGGLGERDDADRYNMDFGGSSVSGDSGSFVDPFSAIKQNPEPSSSQQETEANEERTEAPEELDTYEGEVEDKVEKRALIGDEDADSTGFTYI